MSKICQCTVNRSVVRFQDKDYCNICGGLMGKHFLEIADKEVERLQELRKKYENKSLGFQYSHQLIGVKNLIKLFNGKVD